MAYFTRYLCGYPILVRNSKAVKAKYLTADAAEIGCSSAMQVILSCFLRAAASTIFCEVNCHLPRFSPIKNDVRAVTVRCVIVKITYFAVKHIVIGIKTNIHRSKVQDLLDKN